MDEFKISDLQCQKSSHLLYSLQGEQVRVKFARVKVDLEEHLSTTVTNLTFEGTLSVLIAAYATFTWTWELAKTKKPEAL
jgi:hypothetical protein